MQSKEAKQQKAQVLREERAKRTAEEQLALLDKRFGKGKGAAKERAKLAIQMTIDKNNSVDNKKKTK